MKIGTGEGIAIRLDIAPHAVSGDRRIAPAEFPAGVLSAKTPAFQTDREGGGIQCVQRRDAIDNNQPMYVKLQLHQQLVILRPRR
jgi:hypothetical protein